MHGSNPEPDRPSDQASERGSEGGVADALRAAVERTMQATAGSAVTTRERATELVDDVVRLGRDARDELARRGQEAGAGLARRGQEATGEVGRRLEALERRLAELESELGPRASVGSEKTPGPGPDSNPQAKG